MKQLARSVQNVFFGVQLLHAAPLMSDAQHVMAMPPEQLSRLNACGDGWRPNALTVVVGGVSCP